MSDDKVRPAHYDGDAMIRSAARRGHGRAFGLETAVKYLWRAGRKPGEARELDLEKARWYLVWLRDHLAEYELAYEASKDDLWLAIDIVRSGLVHHELSDDQARARLAELEIP